MTNYKKILIFLAFTLVVLPGCSRTEKISNTIMDQEEFFYASTNSTSEIKKTELAFNEKFVEEEYPNAEIRLKYPVFNNIFLDDAIQSFIITEKELFEKDFADNDNSFLSYGVYSLYIDYDIYTPSLHEDLLSIEFILSYYTGGAHPNSTYMTFLFDKERKKILELEDVLVTNDNQKGQLRQEIIRLLQIQDIGSDEEWIKDGVQSSDLSTFVLNDRGIVFIFSPYEVGPYAAGDQRVGFSYTELNGILSLNYNN